MTEFTTQCNCGCGKKEVEGAENAELEVFPKLNDEDYDQYEHLRGLIPQWLEEVPFRNQSDVKDWKAEGYRPSDIIRRLKLENERGEPIDGHPWPDKTRDPRTEAPYPVSVKRNSVRRYNADKGKFEWDLSVSDN